MYFIFYSGSKIILLFKTFFKDIKNFLRKFLIKQIKINENPTGEINSQDSENTALDDISGDDLKMVFVVREDLKMGIGKQCSQVAHAAVGRILLTKRFML